MSNSKTAKVTAAQIEKGVDLPPRLQEIGEEITARLTTADRALERAENHTIAIDQLLSEAKAFCDEGGFKRFKEKFCPSLGRSRSYELFAVSAGRKTDEQTKNETRERQRKYRTKIKAKLAETERLPVGDRPDVEIGPLVTDEPERNAVNATDIALREFNEKILRLVQMTRGRKPERFDKTSVRASDLSQFGRFLEKVAAASEASTAERAGQLCDIEQEPRAGDLEAVS
jgi:hypothetical protein